MITRNISFNLIFLILTTITQSCLPRRQRPGLFLPPRGFELNYGFLPPPGFFPSQGPLLPHGSIIPHGPSMPERPQDESQYPICVIGAGISGLNTATLLQEKGYKVEVFEKEPIVGGKAKSFRIPGEIQVEMCPLLFSTGHESLIKKITQYHLTPVALNVADRADINPHKGEVIPQHTLTITQRQHLKKLIKSYNTIRSTFAKDLESGYLHTSPELFLPTSKWLKSRNLEELIPAFSITMTSEGYGHLDDVPALYTLQLIDEHIIDGLVLAQPGVIYTLREGLDTLLHRMALSLKVSLYSEVINIDRGGKHPIITFKTNQRRFCSKVILAFPPLLPNLERIMPDLTPKERYVFNQVKIHKYMSAANSIPFFKHSLYEGKLPIEGTGEVTAIIKQSFLRRKDIYSSYSWIRGEFNTIPSAIEFENMTIQLHSTLEKIGPYHHTFFVFASEYFPHVTSQSLKGGFYKAFNALQGKNQIYYATTLLNFELMEKALKMTEDFVKRYF